MQNTSTQYALAICSVGPRDLPVDLTLTLFTHEKRSGSQLLRWYLSSHGRVSSMIHVRKINLADFLKFVFEVSTRQKCRRVKFCVYSWVLLFLLLSPSC